AASGRTDLPAGRLSTMAGPQLPLIALFIPLSMVKVMCSWRRTLEVWPALAVAGGSFAVFQFTFATIDAYLPGVVLYPMTDIGGGIFSLVVTALFLKFWRPKQEWHFDKATATAAQTPGAKEARGGTASDPHAAGAAALFGSGPPPQPGDEEPLTWKNVSLAWAPYALMSVLLLLTGLVRQEEGKHPVIFGQIQTNYMVPVPGLDGECL